MKKIILSFTTLCVLVSQLNPFIMEASSASIVPVGQQTQANSAMPSQDLASAQQNAQDNVDAKNQTPVLIETPKNAVPLSTAKTRTLLYDTQVPDFSISAGKDAFEPTNLKKQDHLLWVGMAYEGYGWQLDLQKLVISQTGVYASVNYEYGSDDWRAALQTMINQTGNIFNILTGDGKKTEADQAKQSLELLKNLLNPPSLTWGVPNYNLSVSVDGKTLQFVDKMIYQYNFTYNFDTKKITNLKTSPPAVIDQAVNPGDWMRVMDQIIAQASSIKNNYAPAADKETIQKFIDTLKRDQTQVNIQVFDNQSLVELVVSANVVEVRPYGSLQFSLNKITKAITYVDSQGSHTVNPSDFNNWFAAGQNMIVGAEKHGLGATGTSQVLDAIYTALGAEYKISAPSGSAHDQAPGGMEAVKYPNVIFVQGADGTRYYLDLVNKIAYAGTYGQNGASKNDPSQNLLFNLCVQQMLNNANVYDQNSFLSVTDKQNLEKIIALLKPQIPTVAWGASDYNLSVSMDGKTLQFVDKRANGYNYLYNSSTKKITNLNTNPPTIIDPILNHSDWLNAMNMMIAQAVFVRDHYTPASDRSRVQSLIDLLNQQL